MVPAAPPPDRRTKIEGPSSDPLAVGAGVGAVEGPEAGWGGAENEGGDGIPTGSPGATAPGASGKGGAEDTVEAERVGSGIAEGSGAFGFPKRRPKIEGFSGSGAPSIAAAITSLVEPGSGEGAGLGGFEAASAFIAEISGSLAAGGARAPEYGFGTGSPPISAFSFDLKRPSHPVFCSGRSGDEPDITGAGRESLTDRPVEAFSKVGT